MLDRQKHLNVAIQITDTQTRLVLTFEQSSISKFSQNASNMCRDNDQENAENNPKLTFNVYFYALIFNVDLYSESTWLYQRFIAHFWYQFPSGFGKTSYIEHQFMNSYIEDQCKTFIKMQPHILKLYLPPVKSKCRWFLRIPILSLNVWFRTLRSMSKFSQNLPEPIGNFVTPCIIDAQVCFEKISTWVVRFWNHTFNIKNLLITCKIDV